ncbi:MAG: FkbM family methyltransferase [Candidatus Bathyarchaeia archaeon]
MVWSRLPRGIIAIQPFGIDGGIIVREIYFEQVYDRFYRLQNDDVVVDVGAHVGLFTLKVAKSVKLVLAVEPHPFNYRLLTVNVALNKLNNVTPVKLALSSYSGKAKLSYILEVQGHIRFLKVKYLDRNLVRRLR